eukprot:gene766-949_t
MTLRGYIINLDVALLVFFLAANLLLGLFLSHRAKTLREYAIGTKTFSTAAITSTIIATWISGSFMFYALQNIYTKGLQFIMVAMGSCLALLIIGQVLAKRMGEFLNNVSLAEAMRDLYGKQVQIITAITGIILSTGHVAAQFYVISKMLSFLLHIEGQLITVIAAGIVVVYSAFGGLRAVTMADIFQFITFSIFIPVLSLMIWNQLQDPSQVAIIVDTSPLFSWKSVFNWNYQTLSMLGLFFYFALPIISPPIFQRIAMAKNTDQVRDAFSYAAGISLLTLLGISWIAVLLLADPTEKDPQNLISHLLTHYAYPGLKGSTAIGIIAMAMSTADANLHAAAVLVTNDLMKPWQKYNQHFIPFVRLSTLGLGLLALLLALHINDLLKVLLFSASFFIPMVSAPFLLAILGFRSEVRAVYMGMAGGLLTVIIWGICFKNHDGLIPGMLVNFICLMGSHYLLKEKGGWIGIKDKAPLLIAYQKRKKAWAHLLQLFQKQTLFTYLQKQLPSQEIVYTLVGIYSLGATYTSFFTVTSAIIASHELLYHLITYSTLIFTAVFMTYPAWPTFIKPTWFISFVWPLGIAYLLFVIGGLLVIMSGFHQVQVMIFMLNLIIASLLLSWPLIITLCIGALIIARTCYIRYGGDFLTDRIVMSLQFQILYTVLLFSGSLIAIIRFRNSKKLLERKHTYLLNAHQATEQNLIQALSDERRFIKTLDIEGVTELKKTVQIGHELAQYLQSLEHSMLPTDFQNVFATFQHRVALTADYLSTIAHRAAIYLKLTVQQASLGALLQDVLDQLHLEDQLHTLPHVTVENTSNVDTIECDSAKIRHLLRNAILYTQANIPPTTSSPVTRCLFGITATHLSYQVNLKEEHIKRIPALCFTFTTQLQLPEVAPDYLTNMEQPPLSLPPDKHNLRILENQRIIQAHYGYMELQILKKDTIQTYIIPQQLRNIRPKEMDLPEFEPGAEIQAADHNYPGAQVQEQHFLHSLSIADVESLKMVHLAIRLIKKYHGPTRRKSGEPFYLHPIAVATIVLAFTDDLDTILSALLHDIVEDTALTLSQLELMFNSNVAHIVDKVTHLDSKKRTFYKLKLDEHENIIQLLRSEDNRALYVKIADRIHNMRTIQGHAGLKKRKKIAEETLHFFVPLSKYLSLLQAAEELEKLSLEVLSQVE